MVVELFILLIFPHVDKQSITIKKLFLIGGIILGLMLGPTMGAITEFGPTQASQYRYPAFEQWRILTIGNYFSHVDFFAIYQWLAGGVLRTSLYVLLASHLLTRKKQKKYTVFFSYSVLIIGCLYRIDQQTFYELVYTIFMPISLLVLTIQLTILFIFLTIQNHKKKLEDVKENG
jgi:heme exporter protein D